MAQLIDCISSGIISGRTAKEAFGFSELNDNCAAYGTKGHRHQPEMAQELNFLGENKVKVLYVLLWKICQRRIL